MKAEEKQKAKEQKDAEEKLKAEEKQKAKEQKDAEEKLKAEEKQKAKEQKDAEEKLKAEEKQKAKEQKDNNDKIVYETEIKPQIDAMLKEYDSIWAQHWKPTWEKSNSNPNSMNKSELRQEMELISEKYDEISNKIVNFKYEDKLTDPEIKKKFTDFRSEFVLATGYRSNAASAVVQGIKGVAPMKGRMEESLKSVKLSDEKLINALASMVSMEQKLGILKK
ncbi:ribonuclease [Bacillus cereus]|nr:ribonuclease [Bacillus cereus]